MHKIINNMEIFTINFVYFESTISEISNESNLILTINKEMQNALKLVLDSSNFIYRLLNLMTNLTNKSK